MTKAQEVDLLDKVIKEFGRDSYIGPWLAAIREDLVNNIRNDFPIDFMLDSAPVRWKRCPISL